MRQAIDEKPYTEILAGRSVPKVSPKRRHAILQWRIAALVARLAGDRGDVGTEWRFWISGPGEPRTTLVPDVAFVSRERMAALTPEEREQPPFAPDLAIEVRSPSDRIADVEWKRRAYLAAGARVVIDVLPEAREIRALSTAGDATLRIGERYTSDALLWLAFDVADIFAGLD
ncbi:MAG: Uma2 family endonuclease [bacterium]|nr:Uma2 family endonuclease [bacterium]